MSISISPSSVTLDPGPTLTLEEASPSADITVTVTRGGGFSGAVTVSVEGTPSGVSASSTTIAGSSTTGSLTLEATSSAAAGTSSLTVRATGSGVTDATATLSLTVNEAPVPGFSIAVNPASVSLEQGQSTTANLSVTRTNGFAGDVALSASGQPSGLTISFDPATVSGDASQVQVAAGSGVTPGTYTVTITGSTSGLDDATASLSVEVTESSGTGETVTLTYCEASGVPSWLAVKDGNGPWVTVEPVQPVFGGPVLQGAAVTYQFQITSDKAGVAAAYQTNGSANLSLFYAAREEIGFQGGNHCPGAGITKTVNGTVAGLGLTDQAFISLGGASASVFGAAGGNYTLMNVPDGPVDLVASQVALTINGNGFTQTPLAMIIWRSLNPADNAVLPVLDFGSGDAFAPTSQTLTINNLGSDVAVVSSSYVTANGGSSLFFSDYQPVAGNTRSFPGVPAGQQAAGDFHSLAVVALDPGLPTLGDQRSATVVFNQAADQTVTLGPEMTMPTITWPSVNPYVMFRAQVPRQEEYGQYVYVAYSQTGGRGNTTTIGATAAYLGGMDMDEMIPNFSGMAGFNDDWGPELGVATTWTVFGASWSGPGGIIQNPYADGVVSLTAGRFGEITP
jgi:hypothetical protein